VLDNLQHLLLFGEPTMLSIKEKKKLLNFVSGVPITVKKISELDLISAVSFYHRRDLPDFDIQDSERDRLCLGFIRHQATNYEKLIPQMRGEQAAVKILKQRVNQAIAKVYPQLRGAVERNYIACDTFELRLKLLLNTFGWRIAENEPLIVLDEEEYLLFGSQMIDHVIRSKIAVQGNYVNLPRESWKPIKQSIQDSMALTLTQYKESLLSLKAGLNHLCDLTDKAA
jgi:hypothetical protein